MYTNEIAKVAESAKDKIQFIQSSPFKYFMLAMMSGFFIIIGVALSFSVAAIVQVDGKMYGKIAIGLTFWVALGLLVFAGGELFTGNCFVFTVGCLKRSVHWKQTLQLLVVNYFGNLAGCIVLAFLYVKSRAMVGVSDAYIENTALSKLSIPSSELFFRAVLCNFVVCLAIWLCYKMKEETAKLILMLFCVLAFAASGFEHSIANMGIFSIAWMLPHSPDLTLYAIIKNIAVVTLGNMLGASLLLGLPYWYVASTKEKDRIKV